MLGDAASVFDAALRIESSSATVRNCLFDDFELFGVYVPTAVQPTIENCTFTGAVGVAEDVRGHAMAFTNFSNNDALMHVIGGTPVSAAATWPKHEYELNGDVTVTTDPGATLTISPGTEVRFPFENRDLIVDGTLVADGSDADPVRFIGSNSDPLKHGGTIYLRSASTNSIVRQAQFIKLGDAASVFDAALRVDTSSVTIERNIFTDSETSGIRVGLTAAPRVEKCDIFDNLMFGINNTGTGIVNAEDNWWGDATGPTHASNPLGMGDTVSNGVDFDPWLNAPTRFLLDVQPTAVAPSQTVTFTTAFGQFGGAVALTIVAVNGVDLGTPTVVLATTFPMNLQWVLPIVTPPGLTGLTLSFQSVGVNTCGNLAFTPRVDALFL